MTISLCMIVKNEEDTLERCLKSASPLVDEIIIVDTGSTDLTKQIASTQGAKLFDFPWIDDFSAARNFAFSKGTMDYCLWLDADDVILPEDLSVMLSLKQTILPGTDIVMMRYHTAFDEAGKPTFSYYRERLIRRAAGLSWKGRIHESIEPAGKIIYCEAAVTHRKLHSGDPDRNLHIFEKMLAEGIAFEPREQFYYARELTYHARDTEAVTILENFLATGHGWVENNLEACRVLSQCYQRLGEEQKSLRALLRSLEYGLPRAELCCDIGGWFFHRQNYKTAVFWYQQALLCERDDARGGFVLPDCYDYLPALQLCVCFFRLGDVQKAILSNERAAQAKPDSSACQFNRTFFQQLSPSEASH